MRAVHLAARQVELAEPRVARLAEPVARRAALVGEPELAVPQVGLARAERELVQARAEQGAVRAAGVEICRL